eukprot:4595017-Amphidinium_carterae.1
MDRQMRGRSLASPLHAKCSLCTELAPPIPLTPNGTNSTTDKATVMATPNLTAIELQEQVTAWRTECETQHEIPWSGDTRYHTPDPR